MSLADELLKLEQLRRSEALTAQEFEDAKRALLYPPPPVPERVKTPPPPTDLRSSVSPAFVSPAFERSASEYFERRNRADRNRIAFSILGSIVVLIIVLFGAPLTRHFAPDLGAPVDNTKDHEP